MGGAWWNEKYIMVENVQNPLDWKTGGTVWWFGDPSFIVVWCDKVNINNLENKWDLMYIGMNNSRTTWLWISYYS